MAKYVDYNTPEEVAYNDDAIDNSIHNILTTVKGSIPGKPTFGSNLSEYLFSNMDHITLSLISSSVKDTLNKFEPRIIVTSSSVEQVPEYNRINITVNYKYVDTGLDVHSSTTIPLSV